MTNQVTYQVTSKKHYTTTRCFNSLEAAIKWCDSQKTKFGHYVSHIEEWYENDKKHVGTIKDYETFGNKNSLRSRYDAR